MATIDEIFAAMPEESTTDIINDVLTIDPNTRKITVPESESVFGVEFDNAAERKFFQCPRFVGNDIDLSACVVRVNYKNANNEVDAYIVTDVTVVGENVAFSWEISEKAVRYKGRTQFLVCASIDGMPEWHTTLAYGTVLEGLEPDTTGVEEATSDVIAQLVSMVNAQIDAVESAGVAQVAEVNTAADEATAAAKAEIEAKKETVLAEIPDDYTALSDTVGSLVRNTAGAIVCEVSGETIVVEDASNNYLQNLRVFGKSTQDGTPTPDAPVEIVSVVEPMVTVCGKNLATQANETISAQGITSSPTEHGTVMLDGTATLEMSRVIAKGVVLAPGKYTASVQGLNIVNSNHDRVFLTGENGVIVNYVMTNEPKTFEVTESTTAYATVVFNEGSTYSNAVILLQVEAGDTATNYEHYKTTQSIALTHTLPGIPVASGGNYTDSDGQEWICDEIDFERGVYVQRVAVVDLATVTKWLHQEGWTNEASFYAPLVNKHPYISYFDVANMYCTRLPISTPNNISTTEKSSIGLGGNSGSVYVCIEGVTSVDELSAYFAENETVICYPIATPIETALSETELAAYVALHSNKPTTTILNDSGAYMSAEYVADTKLYIDKKIAALGG